MITKCLSCGKIFDVEPSWKGQEVTCDSCGKDFTVKKYIECPQCSQLTPEDEEKCKSCNAFIKLKRPAQFKASLSMPSSKKAQSVPDSGGKATESGSLILQKQSKTIDYDADKIAIESVSGFKMTRGKIIVLAILAFIMVRGSIDACKIYTCDKAIADALRSSRNGGNYSREGYSMDAARNSMTFTGKRASSGFWGGLGEQIATVGYLADKYATGGSLQRMAQRNQDESESSAQRLRVLEGIGQGVNNTNNPANRGVFRISPTDKMGEVRRKAKATMEALAPGVKFSEEEINTVAGNAFDNTK